VSEGIQYLKVVLSDARVVADCHGHSVPRNAEPIPALGTRLLGANAADVIDASHTELCAHEP